MVLPSIPLPTDPISAVAEAVGDVAKVIGAIEAAENTPEMIAAKKALLEQKQRDSVNSEIAAGDVAALEKEVAG